MRKLCVVFGLLLACFCAGCGMQNTENRTTETANAAVRAACVTEVRNTPQDRQYLTMEDGKDFRIVTVTDAHLTGPNGVAFIKKYLGMLIDNLQPDLVVFDGDNVDSGVNADGSYNHLTYLEQVFQFLEEKQQHWALTLGNHDRDPYPGMVPMGLKAQSDLAAAYSNGEKGIYGMYRAAETGYEEVLDWRAYADPDLSEWHNARYGNYAISVQSGGKTVYTLAMLDSGQHESTGSRNNGYIKEYQVQWYEQYMKMLAEEQYGAFDLLSGKYIPNIVFTHQPIPEYVFAAKQALGDDGKGEIVDDRYGFGQNSEDSTAIGQREEINTGMFATMKRIGATHMFCGHIHGNNTTVYYDGISLSELNRFARRDNETASWPDSRVNFTKLVTIKAGTYEVEECFALYDGTLTTDYDFALSYPLAQ